jgi:hypothetical protein
MSGSAAQSRLRTTVSDMWRVTNAKAVAPPGGHCVLTLDTE